MGERQFLAKDDNCAKLLTEMSFAVGLQIDLLRPTARNGAAAPSDGAGDSTSAPISSAATAAPFPTLGTPPAAGPSAPAGSLAAPPEREIAATAKAPRSREATEPVAEPATVSLSSRWSMWVGLGPSLAWGLSPSASADGRLFFGVRRDDLSVELAADASYPSSQRYQDGSGFRESLIGASAALCGHRHALALCLLGKASQIRITGLGLDEPRSPSGFVPQAGLRFAAALPLAESWSLAAHLDALGLLRSCTVVLNQVVVWDMPRLGALAGIDLSARFR
jgi:hypothetical protein